MLVVVVVWAVGFVVSSCPSFSLCVVCLVELDLFLVPCLSLSSVAPVCVVSLLLLCVLFWCCCGGGVVVLCCCFCVVSLCWCLWSGVWGDTFFAE